MGVMMNVLTTGKHIKEELNNTLLKDIIKKCTHISAEKRYDNVLDLKVELKNKLYNEKKIEGQNKINTKYYTKKEKLKHLNNNSKTLPGFRSKNFIYMICATFWYLFLIMGLFIAKSFKEFLGNVTLVVMLLSIYFIFTNYLNIKNKLPLLKSERILIRVVGYWIYSTGIFLIGGGLLTLTMN